jgi:hypothetical protein
MKKMKKMKKNEITPFSLLCYVWYKQGLLVYVVVVVDCRL